MRSSKQRVTNLNKASACFGHCHNHAPENSDFRFALSFCSSLPHFSSSKCGFLSSETTLSNKAAPNPAFHVPEQEVLSDLLSAPTIALVTTPAGSTLRTNIALLRHVAVHSSTEMWQLYKPGRWTEALPGVSYSLRLVWETAVQNSTAWLCKAAPCAY